MLLRNFFSKPFWRVKLLYNEILMFSLSSTERVEITERTYFFHYRTDFKFKQAVLSH